jgi:hypothetical protein
VIRGLRAPQLLTDWGFPARLVGVDGTVQVLNGWPEES